MPWSNSSASSFSRACRDCLDLFTLLLGLPGHRDRSRSKGRSQKRRQTELVATPVLKTKHGAVIASFELVASRRGCNHVSLLTKVRLEELVVDQFGARAGSS